MRDNARSCAPSPSSRKSAIDETSTRRFHYNTTIARLDELVNAMTAARCDEHRPLAGCYTPCRVPICSRRSPRISPKNSGSGWGTRPPCTCERYPEPDPTALAVDEITLVVQVNGKVRARIVAPAGIEEEQALERALADANVRAHLEGKTLAKQIYVARQTAQPRSDVSEPARISTGVCIVGGGPCGMMLGVLLARAGVEVTVLEKHADFFRDFRGDTIHPSTLELLYELGWLSDFLALPHDELAAVSGRIFGETVEMADFSHLPTHCKFIALMPQWDFLNFLAERGRHYPTFGLRMETHGMGLLESDGRVTGVRATSAAGEIEIARQARRRRRRAALRDSRPGRPEGRGSRRADGRAVDAPLQTTPGIRRSAWATSHAGACS